MRTDDRRVQFRPVAMRRVAVRAHEVRDRGRPGASHVGPAVVAPAHAVAVPDVSVLAAAAPQEVVRRVVVRPVDLDPAPRHHRVGKRALRRDHGDRTVALEPGVVPPAAVRVARALRKAARVRLLRTRVDLRHVEVLARGDEVVHLLEFRKHPGRARRQVVLAEHQRRTHVLPVRKRLLRVRVRRLRRVAEMPNASFDGGQVPRFAAGKQGEWSERVMHRVAERSVGALVLDEVLEQLLGNPL